MTHFYPLEIKNCKPYDNLLDNHSTAVHDHILIISDKKIICSYVDTPASGGGAPSHAAEGPIEAFCRAGDRMTLALGKVDSSAA